MDIIVLTEKSVLAFYLIQHIDYRIVLSLGPLLTFRTYVDNVPT